MPTSNCPTLQDYIAGEQCKENLAGVASAVYAFNHIRPHNFAKTCRFNLSRMGCRPIVRQILTDQNYFFYLTLLYPKFQDFELRVDAQNLCIPLILKELFYLTPLLTSCALQHF